MSKNLHKNYGIVTVVWESVGYKMVDLAPTVNVEGYKYRSFGYRHVLKVTRYVGGISQLGYQTKSGMIWSIIKGWFNNGDYAM